MTREQWIAKHRDSLAGIIADAVVNPRKGPELSIWLRQQFERVDRALSQLYDEAQKAAQPQNGRPVTK